MSRFASPRRLLVAALCTATVLAGCSPAPDPAQPSPTASAPPPLDEGFFTPMPYETGIAAALRAGEVPVEIPEAWADPEQSPRVDEGYVLQDFTWFLDGSPEGDIVTAAAMTPAQAEALSGGSGFDAHVEGLAQVLAFEGDEQPAVERMQIGGVAAARIDTSTPEGMRIVLWLYDLGEAYYELGFYGAPGAPASAERVAEFDAVARTFAVP